VIGPAEASTAPSPSRDARRLASNLWRYPVLQALWMTPFFVPVIVLFWQENGLNAFDVYLRQSLLALGIATTFPAPVIRYASVGG